MLKILIAVFLVGSLISFVLYGLDKAKAEIGDKARCEEDVLSYVAFPQVAEKFFDARAEKEQNTVKYSIVAID